MTCWILNEECVAGMRAMPDNCIAAVVTDPPYGLSDEPDMVEVLRHWLAGDDYQHTGGGFMGKTWDSFVPGPSVWREVMRVLKPGGHVLSFSGTRTYDLSVLAMRLAGFEIRDQLAWLYGTGFPKSLDVSKAIDSSDAAEARRARQLRFTEWIRSVGLTASRIDAATGTNMGGHYTAAQSQPAVATREHFEKLRSFFGEAPAWVEALVDERTVESENMKRREVIGKHDGLAPAQNMRANLGGETVSQAVGAITIPYTPDAQRWSGWGTALKPAQEPIVLARKPLAGTVAANVLAHGTGALNIDGCRIEGAKPDGVTSPRGAQGRIVDDGRGRWPANVLFEGEDIYPPEAFDKDGNRFFYVAKASPAEREAGLDHLPLVAAEVDGAGRAGRHGARRNHHPTVKPIELMRYLIRLITPPGGLVLDPFAGSGTTGVAATLEGFDFLGFEMMADYAEIARARIRHHGGTIGEV